MYIRDIELDEVSSNRLYNTFANEQFSRVYGDISLFGVKVFGMDELITPSNINYLSGGLYRVCILSLFLT